MLQYNKFFDSTVISRTEVTGLGAFSGILPERERQEKHILPLHRDQDINRFPE